MKLTDYFSKDRDEFLKLTPETGEQTDWLDFCELELKGANFLIVDAQFVPSEKDGLLVALSPAKYSVQGKAINYGGDRRVSRLRVFQNGSNLRLGDEIGKTWTDTANTGICDFETFSKAWGNDDDASYKIIEPFFESLNDVGIAVLAAASGAIMPFVHSGFGDGTFSVFELQAEGKRVGFEIEFITDDEKYPFGKTPFQSQALINEIENRAAQGDVEAQLQLGNMYQAGKEVGKNLETAAKWFEQATQNGNAEAALRLGAMCKVGKGKSQDYGRAKELFELAAARGSVSALNELGRMYRHGQGVAVDCEKAVAFYRQAAEKGFAHAQYNLAVHCAKGWGIQQSYEEAAKWYRLAAD
ncbi:MAG: tetratricopeptide repeat protein, partial [Verrucomicrobiota bacterium]